MCHNIHYCRLISVLAYVFDKKVENKDEKRTDFLDTVKKSTKDKDIKLTSHLTTAKQYQASTKELQRKKAEEKFEELMGKIMD